MRKTSVYLPDHLKRALTARATATRRSEAEVLRAAVELEVATRSPAAIAAVNLADSPRPGRLVGVGVGPGDPDLLTMRALTALRRADRVLGPSTAPDAIGRAETIVREAAPDVEVERVAFAMHPDPEVRATAMGAIADTVTGYLDDGDEVAFITLGDPLTYSTFSSLADAVSARRPVTLVEVVPGIMAFQSLAARTNTTLVDERQRLSVRTALDGDISDGGLADDLADPACTVVLYKGGRHLPAVADAARDADRLDNAVAGELLGMTGQRVGPLHSLARGPASYLATVILPATEGGIAPTTPPSTPTPTDTDPTNDIRADTDTTPSNDTPADIGNDTTSDSPGGGAGGVVISFVGAGPGAADLLTLRGAGRLREAEVVVWASSLVPAELLQHCRDGVTIHDSATMTLEDVLGVYASHPEETPIVRLHSGDPSLYGAVQEQVDWCAANDRAWEVVPGVSSVSAASAAVGRELTIPGVSQSVVVTRLAGRTAESMPPGEGVAEYAGHGGTLAVLLSAARPDELQEELLAPGSAYGPRTPAAIVVRATWPDELVVHTTVGELAEALRATRATMTALVLVGEALAPRSDERRSHLYAPAYTTAYRLRSDPGSTGGRPSARRTDARAALTDAPGTG